MLSGKEVGYSVLFAVSLFHPCASGHGSGMTLIDRHNCILFTLSMNASLVGGRAAKLVEDE